MTTYTTCPWCGTNYAAFQSNCNNCGGPIPPPQQDIEESSPSPEPDIILPPPPPRPISDRYKWRFMLSDGWSIAAGIFVMLGLIFSTVGGSLTFAILTALIGVPFLLLGLAFLVGGVVVFYWRHDEAVKLVNVLKHGEAVRGQVIDLQENQNIAINNRHPWKIVYAFQVNGRELQGEVTTLNEPGPHIFPGRAVCVLYLQTSPDHNSIYPHP